MVFDLFAPFLVGFVGSLHCLGMCGPLIVAYSLHLRNLREGLPTRSSAVHLGVSHHALFHMGRLLTYGFLGALAAGLFYMANLALFFKELRGSLTVVGGVLMMLLGLVILRVVPLPKFFRVFSDGKGFGGAGWFVSFFHSKRLGSKVGLGLATGFLPCGLSWAMIAKAAATQNVAVGFLTMIAFGLGTIPILLMTGVSASFFSLKTRLFGERIAALSVILMGLILVYRGGRSFV
jgi:sulfite exporter TauE/SafE